MFNPRCSQNDSPAAGGLASHLLARAGLPPRRVLDVVERALEEDVDVGDVTTDALIDPDWRAGARLVAKADGVVAGLGVSALVFAAIDPGVRFAPTVEDGARVAAGNELATLDGPARAVLTGERVALNFLQRLSGVATLTRAYVDAVRGLHAQIVDTRKTTPGLRLLERYAVRVGGGVNHRFNLTDGFMAKDNHLAALARHGRDLASALRAARRRLPHVSRLEVEVERLDQIEPALYAGADVLLLDNMTPDTLQEAVRRVSGRAVTEASGGISLDRVREVAESGVDYISVGALTHSAASLDVSLDVSLDLRFAASPNDAPSN